MMKKTIAMLFPGQGAQAVGMGQDLAEALPSCRELYQRADEVLGMPLSRICFEGPAEELTRSDVAQAAIFVASVACWTALRERLPELRPAAVAGLSLGEYTALYAAGVLDFDTALRVLAARGRFMQQACEAVPGAMLSVIGLDADALVSICGQSGAEIANYNSPQQTVLSGTREAMAAAELLCKEAGAKRAIPLQVAGAFHSSLMAPAAKQLLEFLGEISFAQPVCPVVSNVTARPYDSTDVCRDLLSRQVTSSVRWVDSIRWMREEGVACFVECGPGSVLTGLLKRTDREAVGVNLAGYAGLDAAVEQISN